MWRPLTDDDIRSAITSAEDTAFRTKLITDGQSDPYAQICGQITGLFRDAIRGNAANELDPEVSHLPEGAIFHAVAVIRQRLCTRFGIGEQTEARTDEYKAAMDYLKGLPSGPTVEKPSNSEEIRQPIGSPGVNQSPRREGWRNQDGI